MKKPTLTSAAFTLVEVVLAIGIVSFAFVAIMGMLPVGLATFENSINSTVQSQIAQRLFSEAQQVKFANLESLATGRYFDDEGLPVGQGSTPPSTGFVYHAVVNPPTTAFINNAYVRTITIDIGKNRTVETLRTDAPTEISRVSFMVADVGT